MKQSDFTVSGRIIDILTNEIYPGVVHISNGKINNIERKEVPGQHYILPGFTDAHVHIESSMLVPTEFARLAVVHGTVATVSDPHEIGNVLGVNGVKYMIENGKKVPFRFYFGAPSCVPATVFETAGATITAADIEQLLLLPDIKYLAEMMNWPGVLNRDAEVMEKLTIAQKLNKPVDGHAPGLTGQQAKQYAAAGISTDHECFTADEAKDKLACGMHILIREGSAAKNFGALIDLIEDHADRIMFCSDDKHPDNLVEGHINVLVKRALAKGHDLMKVLRAACVNPVLHYKLENGLLRPGDAADFIVVDNLENFEIKQTYIQGQLVAENGKSLLYPPAEKAINYFESYEVTEADLQIKGKENAQTAVIEALDGQLITNRINLRLPVINGFIQADPENDVLKIVVVNRYKKAPPAVAFIKNFGLKKGALASSVAHDSHNIIAVGVTDTDLERAINRVIEAKGGVAAVTETEQELVPLPVAGLMSTANGYEVAEAYSRADALSKKMGSTLSSPFMTLSFMALLVIPALKLSDKGLFNGEKFQFVE